MSAVHITAGRRFLPVPNCRRVPVAVKANYLPAAVPGGAGSMGSVCARLCHSEGFFSKKSRSAALCSITRDQHKSPNLQCVAGDVKGLKGGIYGVGFPAAEPALLSSFHSAPYPLRCLVFPGSARPQAARTEYSRYSPAARAPLHSRGASHSSAGSGLAWLRIPQLR